MNAFLQKLWPFARWERTAVCVLLAICGSIIAYWFWAASAERLIQNEIAIAHAHGEFILAEEYPQPAAVPDGQNAATYWRRAIASAALTPEQQKRELDLITLGQFPPNSDELTFLRDIFANRDEFFANVTQAAEQPAVDWKLDPRSYLLTMEIPELSDVRWIAMLLKYHALLAHVDGDDRAVVAHAIDALELSRDVESLPPSLVTHLVAVGVSAVGASIIESTACDLQIAENADRAASPARVKELIAALLDESALSAGFKTAMQAERAQTLRLGRKLTVKPVFGPTQKIALARSLRWERVLEESALQPNYPAAKKFQNATPPPPDKVYSVVPALTNMLHAGLTRAIETEYRIRCDRRLVALALAIRWYQVDHAGQLPDRLEQLVPTYLPSVPLDPFAGDGRTISYRRNGDRPIIYSVGVDGVDDGGSFELIKPNQQRRGDNARDRWMEKDAAIELVRIPREAPTTKTTDR